MHTLTERIDIDAPFERLCDWADNFEEEFVRWSLYHLECELYDGGVTVSSRVRFREIVMGLDYDVTGTITQSVRDRDHFRFVFRSDRKTAFITFEGERTEAGCRFSHTESFGVGTPIIFNVFFRKKANWQLIRDDMILDNRYLKEILEEGRYPERISPDELRRKRA